jgi:hypothetical protein
MTEEELASYLHSEDYFYHVEKKKRSKKWISLFKYSQ